MCCWRWLKETNIKNPQIKPQRHVAIWQIHAFMWAVSQEKDALLCIQKMWMSFWCLWISRWHPITVILSVSMSSTVPTQLPEDGELAWFNHPFTRTHCDDHTHCDETGAWTQHCDSLQSPLHYKTLSPPPPPPILHFPTTEFLFVDISSCQRKDTWNRPCVALRWSHACFVQTKD